jgi:hypothetical protein
LIWTAGGSCCTLEPSREPFSHFIKPTSPAPDQKDRGGRVCVGEHCDTRADGLTYSQTAPTASPAARYLCPPPVCVGIHIPDPPHRQMAAQTQFRSPGILRMSSSSSILSGLVSSRTLSGLACGSVQHRLPALPQRAIFSATRSRDVCLSVYPVFSDMPLLADRVRAARR